MKRSWQYLSVLATANPKNVPGVQANIGTAEIVTVKFAVVAAAPQVLATPPTNTAPPNNPTVSAPSFSCVATVTFMLGGAQSIRKVSVGNGVTISGLAESVFVQLQDQTLAAVSHNQGYQIQSSAGVGVRPTVEQPPTYFRVGLPFASTNDGPFDLTPGETFAVNVPQDAGPISVNVTAVAINAGLPQDGQPEVVVTQQTATFEAFYSQANEGFIPLVPNVDTIALTNVDPTLTARVSVLWGIDG